MTGYNLLLDTGKVNAEISSELKNVFEQKLTNSHVKKEGLEFCIHKPYSHYPYRFFKINDTHILLEGMAYDSEGRLEKAFIKHLQKDNADIKGLQAIMSGVSGEWVCWILHGNTLSIINDRLGHLNVFLMIAAEKVFVGRSLNWLSQHSSLQPDAFGLTSFLWGGFFLSNSTPYKNVQRMVGGSLIQIELLSGKISYTKGEPINFDKRNHLNLQESAEQLAGLFKKSATDIVNACSPLRVNIALSGGQDSRAVAAALKQTNSALLFATSFSNADSAKDVQYATEIAAKLNIPYLPFAIETRKEYASELLHNTMGMNYLRMDFILDYYHQLKIKYPHGFVMATGDGGDKVMPYTGLPTKIRGKEKLLAKILDRNTSIPLATACDITGFNINNFMARLEEVLAGYPEEDDNNKFIHFYIYEKGLNFILQGEERCRHYFWTTSPFYNIEFFTAAMMVPDNLKKGNKLYRAFQNLLSEELANIPDASMDSGINSSSFRLKKIAYEWLRSAPAPIKNMVRKVKGTNSRNTAGVEEHAALIEKLKQSPALLAIMDADKLAAFLPLANEDQYGYIKTVIALNIFFDRK